MEITIVGAGSYGALIASKYEKNSRARIKAVVSPHKNGFASRYPFITSARAWGKKFGRPTSGDVFDLCVHVEVLLPVLKEFITIGAKNFILPKPVAVSKKDLKELTKIVVQHKLRVVIASQWYYSSLLPEIKTVVGRMKKGGRIAMDFSQSFDEQRRKKYSSLTALLPHMLQILHGIGIPISGMSIWKISRSSICIGQKDGGNGFEIMLTSTINHPERVKRLEIFSSGVTKAILSRNFEGGVHIEPYDVLEVMVDKEMMAFADRGRYWDRNVLSFRKYLPIAHTQARLGDDSRNAVAVIGGGIFGILAGLEIAKKGFSVVLFEKNHDIFLGASLVNQCRVHMGYHYPRDEKTARGTLLAQENFCKLFPDAIVKKGFENYYCFAKEGSLVTKDQCLAFCKKLGLPYMQAFPKKINVAKNKIDFSLKVPEVIFDARKLKQHLLQMIHKTKNMEVVIDAEVLDIAKAAGGYAVSYRNKGDVHSELFSGIVNATYSNVNYLNQGLGVPLAEYQYELCEMPVVKVPWKGNTGVAIMDGPFCGIMPFGFLKEYLLYDVVLSILERSTGVFPDFKFSVPYYDVPSRRKKRFQQIIKKMQLWFPELKDAVYLYSLYATRIVLPRSERSDARPTVISNPAPGVWSIFSGKITTSVPSAKMLADNVGHFINKKNEGKRS